MTAPDSLHGDPELDAASEREQKAAVKAVMMVTRTLRSLGYDLVIVRAVKVVTGRSRECAAPGATAFDMDDRVIPCLPLEAESLRLLARDLDAEFARRGTFEATEGYVEDATRRQTELEREAGS